MSKKEIMETQMIVTTPEKWDVVTRKATGDVALAQIVRLLIIDEVAEGLDCYRRTDWSLRTEP